MAKPNQEAVIREAREEAGCNVEIEKEIGRTIEIREKKKLVNETHCYIAKIIGEKNNPSFEENEMDFSLLWVDIKEAKELIRRNKNSDNLYYNYITERALLFLGEIKKL